MGNHCSHGQLGVGEFSDTSDFQRLRIGTGAKRKVGHPSNGSNIKRPMFHRPNGLSSASAPPTSPQSVGSRTAEERHLQLTSSPTAAMPPPIPAPTGEYSDHKANCHCGAVKFTFSISPPLDCYPVVECNCSICQRNGYLLVYPIKENLKLGDGSEEAMGSYRFGNNKVKHNFCRQCGSSVFFEVLSPPHEAAVEAEGRGERLPVIMGANLRMVTGLKIDKLVIKKVDGDGREPKYAVL